MREHRVFLPVNFYIEPAYFGYEVLDGNAVLIGTAATWEEAQKLLPDGAHEVLSPMYGIWLDENLHTAIVSDGFHA